MMSDKDNNLLKSDILTVGNELSEKLNAIGVPNTFGKASEGKDNLMSIIRMAINGIDMIIEQIREKLKDYYNKSEVNTLLNGKSDTSHNHDSAYANINHNHDNDYSDINHNHDSAYASKNHNHDNDYASKNHNHDSDYASKNELKYYYNTSEVNTLLNGKSDTSHNHDNAYASKSHQHDGADVILSNSNDVDTEIGTIEDDITSINGDITSLNNSLTNFDSLNTWKQIWTDGNVGIHCNKAIGISYLHFNKNVTVGANSKITVHSQFNSNTDEVKCCPLTATYCLTSQKDIYILVDYLGSITVYNRSSSAVTNTNIQAMMVWRAKGYP